MASYQDQFGNNPARQTDEFGNQIHHPSTEATHPSALTTATGGAANQFQPQKHHEGMHGATGGGVLPRSGSGSSSSSEDDGQGGRRKKGMKQKIMEKMPGQHNAHHKNENQGGAYVNDYPTAGMAGEGEQEKKGIMDKIKEKLPGTH